MSHVPLYVLIQVVFLNPMRTTCQLVKTYIPPFIEPIREGVRKSGLMRKFVMQLFSKTCHDWLNKGKCHDMNQSGMVLDGH